MASTNNRDIVNGVTMGADIASASYKMVKGGVSVHAWAASATHVGTLKVQVSNDNSHWVDVPGLEGSASSGSAYNDMFEYEGCARFLRVYYTFSSGAGTLYVNVRGL